MEAIKIYPDFVDLNNHEIIIDEIEGLKVKSLERKENKGLLTIKTANKWINESKHKPIPSMLFSEFWFEGELCILFADTNQGKSILAVQIGNSIARGKPIPGFKLEAEKQIVLYFDFELSAKQFEGRYSTKNSIMKKFENHYQWDQNFYRVEINPHSKVPDGMAYEQYLHQSLEKAISETGAKILIIDNLTYLKSDVERSKDAAPFIQRLQSLIDQHNISILALTHTPKRDLSKPITRNEISGSKRLIDFCDSAFAIGESHLDKGIKYLKQIKMRETEHIYDSENVIICQLIKPFNFLMFEFLNFGTEREHLKEYTEKDKTQRISEVLELKQQGKSNVKIAQMFGVSEGAIRKWIKKGK